MPKTGPYGYGARLFAAIKGKNRPRQEGKTVKPKKAETSNFFELSEDFNEKCELLENCGLELFTLKKELVKMQHRIRERYEKAEEEKYRAIESYVGLIKRLLNLSDDFSPEALKEQGEMSPPQTLEYVQRSLLEAIKREGVTVIPIETQKPFDPACCEPDPTRNVVDNNLPPGTVLNVIAPGYMLGSIRLRKAKVAVSVKEGEVKQ